MKKILALILVVVLALAVAGCTQPADVVEDGNEAVVGENVSDENNAEANLDNETDFSALMGGETADEPAVMSYAEYIAAPVDAPVVVETYVQATQSWWDNKITAYTQNEEGAYFIYEMACSEEDAAKLVPGTKIRVTGYKAIWAGEVEIVDATFEILEGSFVAQPLDVTALLGTEELVNEQNKMVSFKGMTIDSIEYKNGEPGDDIYVTVSKDGASYSFCVEVYLTGTETDVYKAVQALNAGDVVDIDGFLYWYEGVNTHITAVTVAA
ncbi:MAG: hypothetical protein E7588_00340 [Ruminococcaceae bacterium]|nr:hypothetical protein [Oscillospiraceae bacterium]